MAVTSASIPSRPASATRSIPFSRISPVRPNGPYTLAQPAAWAVVGSEPSTPADLAREKALQDLADEAVARISEPALAPDSPAYRQLWDQVADESDRHFRARYGGQLWMTHHIHAHHLAAGNAPAAP